MKILEQTLSLCPKCVAEKKFDKMVVPATVYEENGKVMIKKTCPEHGETVDVYWEDYEMYEKAKKFADMKGVELENPQIKKPKEEIVCPKDCGLCKLHKSHTALANIVMTNRCDLSCWYCFFYQKQNEPVYEPSKEKIREMLEILKNQKPIPNNAIQLTGGEPTMREDLPEIIKMAKEMGFDHVQVNTNCINVSRKPELAKPLVQAGANVCYTSFDGMTPETNVKNYWEFPNALENFRKAKAGIVLVPTVIKGVNDNQLGDILRFAAGNIDVVRGIVYQPVSLVGMMPVEEREKQRITIPGVVKRIEEQTDGQVGREDFYTIPCASKITDFIETLKGGKRYRLSSHFACGLGTYIFKDGDNFVPITRFIDVDGFFEYLDKMKEEIEYGKNKYVVQAKMLINLKKFIDMKKKPKELKISNMILSALTGGNYNSLRDFHHHSLFVGMMHFMDPYNYDVERVKRCVIHYAMPDGRVVPFCAFNVIPELYRDKVQREYSIPAKEWEERTGKKLADDKYHRVIPTGEEAQKIHDFYNKFKKH